MFAACASAVAMDFTMPDGTVLKDVSVSSTSASRVSLTHSEGLAAVDIGQLTDEQRAQLGISYDREAAKAERREKAAVVRSVQQEAALAEAMSKVNAAAGPIYGTFVSKTETGVLLSTRKGEYGTAIIHVVGSFGDPIDEQLISVQAVPAGTFKYTTVLGAASNVQQYRADLQNIARDIAEGRIILTGD